MPKICPPFNWYKLYVNMPFWHIFFKYWDMVLLMSIFVVSMLAVSVVFSPSYLSWSPPAVIWVLFFSSFCGRTSQQNLAYVTLFFFWYLTFEYEVECIKAFYSTFTFSFHSDSFHQLSVFICN